MISSMTFIRRACMWAGLLAVLGCKKDSAHAEPIPEDIRGAYGRQVEDAWLPTLGLEVDVDTLRYSEMTVRIISGAPRGNDYQIDQAEVTWTKVDKPPKLCKGTLARQRNRLLLSLFEIDADEKCEPILDGDWSAWTPRTTFSESMQGTFGSQSLYSAFENLVVTKERIEVPELDALQIEEAVVFVGREDQLIVRRARFGDAVCRGEVRVEEDRLGGTLQPLPTEDPDADSGHCPRLFGTRWSVTTSALPTKPLSNGKVRIEIEGDKLTLTTTDEQNLRCEQTILRTGTRSPTEVGRDPIPVGGGQVLLLSPAKPSSGIEACQGRLENLAAAQCEEYFGAPCAPSSLDALRSGHGSELSCPTHVVIGDPTTSGRKVALLPSSIPNAVCFEMVGDFEE